LTLEGWHGHAKGRVPLLRHEKVLIINTTLFQGEDYEADWEAPMADDETKRGYLERAYQLSKGFAE
jgi:hypothetical protein